MSISSISSKNLSWISKQQAGFPSSSAVSMCVLARGLYTETVRTYKVGYADLFRVIRNELKIIRKPEQQVVWLVRRFGNNGIEVLFASFRANLLSEKPATQIVIPETWLLYGLLEPGILYHVNDSDNYWAYLDEAGKLSVASRVGLMQSSGIFLEALGLTEVDVEKREVEIKALSANRAVAIRWWQFPGLFVLQHVGQSPSFDLQSWLPKLKIGAMLALAYAIGISGWTLWREYSLQAQLTLLKQEASALVSQQQKLDAQVQILTNYQAAMTDRVLHSELTSEIAKTLAGQAQVQNITITDRLILIRGEAQSATAVLEAFSNSKQWENPRFTQPVRPGESGENFTLSVMYPAQASVVSPLGGTGG